MGPIARAKAWQKGAWEHSLQRVVFLALALVALWYTVRIDAYYPDSHLKCWHARWAVHSAKIVVLAQPALVMLYTCARIVGANQIASFYDCPGGRVEMGREKIFASKGSIISARTGVAVAHGPRCAQKRSSFTHTSRAVFHGARGAVRSE